MNYHLKSKPKQNYTTAVGIVVVVALCLLLGFLFPGALRTAAYAVSRPVWIARSAITGSATSVKNFFSFKESLIEKNAALQSQVATLTLKQADYDALSAENQDLKTQLGRAGDAPRVISRVLSRPPQSPYDTLVIDVGSAEGIAAGDRVYLSANLIIGLVSSVTAHSSLVTLFSASGQLQSAVLQRTGASVALAGRGGANLSVDVPKDADVLWGDVFVYPLLSSAIMGNVYYIDSTSQSSFKTLFIRLPENVFSASWVFVEKQ